MVQEANIDLHLEGDPGPPKLSVLPSLFREAREAGLKAACITMPAANADEERQLAKRRHDYKAALRTLGLAIKALENGYNFQDDKAEAKVEAMAKALKILEQEAGLLLRLLDASPIR